MNITSGDLDRVINILSREIGECHWRVAFLICDNRGMGYALDLLSELESAGVLTFTTELAHPFLHAIAPCADCGWSPDRSRFDHADHVAVQTYLNLHHYTRTV